MLVPDFLVSPRRAAIFYADWEAFRFHKARTVSLPTAPFFRDMPEQPVKLWVQ